MTIIAIDPGTACGWAVRYDDSTYQSGEWDLSGTRFDGGGMRYVRFRKFLESLINDTNPGLVAYEEVQRHAGTAAAHVYGGITSHIQEVCEARGIPYCGIPVGTVKKLATGNGAASKDMMIAAANKKWSTTYTAKDNNEVDARWIAEAAIRESR